MSLSFPDEPQASWETISSMTQVLKQIRWQSEQVQNSALQIRQRRDVDEAQIALGHHDQGDGFERTRLLTISNLL